MPTTKKTSDTSYREVGHVFLIVLFALVMLLMLLAILFGGHVYQMALQADARESQLRSVEGFLSSTFKASDTTDGISVGQGPEGDMLSVKDAGGAYEVCIYLSDGKLVEQYKSVEMAVDPSMAATIAELSQFDVEQSGRTVTIKTELGTFTNTTRSGGAQ